MNIGIIGMGGFARSHHRAILDLERKGECRLVCTCDPGIGRFADTARDMEFPARGVALFDDYIDMLDQCRDQLDIVTIPTPLPLHADMHRACVERGLAVYLEKPPTLDYVELEDMLRVEAGAAKLTNVGFSNIIEEPRQILNALGVEVVEMEHHGIFSTCCGGGGGVLDVDRNLAIEVSKNRIRDAVSVGADTIVTACPTCQPTLLRGAGRLANELDLFVDVLDLWELLDEVLD